MKIRLNEVPQDGRNYSFNRETGELNSALEDIVGDHSYDVNFYLKPIGNAFELRGKFVTVLNEVCSKCGYDFEMTIDRTLHEVLFEDQEEYRKSHSVHGNHSIDLSSDGPAMYPYRGDIFDAGEYVHEAVALAEPLYPTCGPNGTCTHSDEVRKIQEKLEAEFALADVTVKESPFSVLKELSANDSANSNGSGKKH